MEKIKIKEVKKRNKMKLKVEEMKEIKGLMQIEIGMKMIMLEIQGGKEGIV